MQPLGMMTPYLTEVISVTKQMLRSSTSHTLVLPEGAVFVAAEGDIRGWGLNFVALPRETLHQFLKGVTTKIRAREGRTLQILIEQNKNLEQLNLQCDSMVMSPKFGNILGSFGLTTFAQSFIFHNL